MHRESFSPIFQAHPIRVYTDQPLRQVLAKPETSGRLLKWAVELGQFEITYHPRTTIKGQALADFIVECTGTEELPNENAPKDVWKLYVDGSATDNALEQELYSSHQLDISSIRPSGSNLKPPITSQNTRHFWQD